MSDTEQSSRNKSHTERPTLPPPEATAATNRPADRAIAAALDAFGTAVLKLAKKMEAKDTSLVDLEQAGLHATLSRQDVEKVLAAHLQAAIQQAEINLLQEQDDTFSAGLSNPSTTPKQRDVMLTLISYIRIEKEERLLKQKGTV